MMFGREASFYNGDLVACILKIHSLLKQLAHCCLSTPIVLDSNGHRIVPNSFGGRFGSNKNRLLDKRRRS